MPKRYVYYCTKESTSYNVNLISLQKNILHKYPKKHISQVSKKTYFRSLQNNTIYSINDFTIVFIIDLTINFRTALMSVSRNNLNIKFLLSTNCSSSICSWRCL